jgi:hypothetical protein
MKDKISQYIAQNKSSWDDETPERHVWKQIEMTLDHQADKKQWWMRLAKVAAVVITLLSVGFVTGIYVGGMPNQHMDVATQSKLDQLEQAEDTYARQVGFKLDKIQDKQSKISIEAELKQMDELYNQLRQEMQQSDNANMDVIINAMLKNHQTKVEMLEYILQKQSQNQQQYEKVNI